MKTREERKDEIATEIADHAEAIVQLLFDRKATTPIALATLTSLTAFELNGRKPVPDETKGVKGQLRDTTESIIELRLDWEQQQGLIK